MVEQDGIDKPADSHLIPVDLGRQPGYALHFVPEFFWHSPLELMGVQFVRGDDEDSLPGPGDPERFFEHAGCAAGSGCTAGRSCSWFSQQNFHQTSPMIPSGLISSTALVTPGK